MSFIKHESLTLASITLSIISPGVLQILATILTLVVSINNLRKAVKEAGGWANFLHNLKNWE